MATVRILVPEHYRQLVTTHGKDQPNLVIAELAKRIHCPTHILTGGSWQQIQHKHGMFLVAHLRVSFEVADRLVQVSGVRGLFIAVLPSADKERTKVTWVNKKPDMNSETYYHFVKQLAEEKKVPIALRQGGGSDLGLVGIKEGEIQNPNKPTHWIMKGTPRHWRQEDVEAFLLQENWKEVENCGRRQKKWCFKAFPPPDNDKQEWWHYCADECHITIAKEKRSPTKFPVSAWLTGPRKTWTSNKETVIQIPDNDPKEVAKTQIDESTQEQPDASLETRERSPRRKSQQPKDCSTKDTEVTPKDPDQLLSAILPGGWRIVNQGGDGDCAFRCVAASLAQIQKKISGDESSKREGARLRALATTNLAKLKNLREAWAEDTTESSEHRNGKPAPRDFDEYVDLMSNQKVWADGFVLQALSLKLENDFVIWKWRQDKVWERYILLGTPAGRKRSQKPPICLALRDGHYRWLERSDPEATVPEAWLKETDEVVTIDLRGAGPGSVLSLSSKGSSGSQKRPSSQLSLDTDTKEGSGKQDLRRAGPGSVLSLSSKGSCGSRKRPSSQLSLDTDTKEESGKQETYQGGTKGLTRKTSKCSKLSLPDNESGTCSLNSAKKQVWFSQKAQSQLSEDCENMDIPKNFAGKGNNPKYRITGKTPDPRKYEIAPVTNRFMAVPNLFHEHPRYCHKCELAKTKTCYNTTS